MPSLETDSDMLATTPQSLCRDVAVEFLTISDLPPVRSGRPRGRLRSQHIPLRFQRMDGPAPRRLPPGAQRTGRTRSNGLSAFLCGSGVPPRWRVRGQQTFAPRVVLNKPLPPSGAA
jgi:hypothetical protein